jgi:catechol 2,3-dioxygenase-like lactoylglutathione lyase family enzyme
LKIGITLDVPDIGQALAFYGAVFGFREVARPVPVYAVVAAGDQSLGLKQAAAGTAPTPAAGPVRDYARHWTPVHLDFHVEEFEATLKALTAAGGQIEQRYPGGDGRPPVAFCSDPFGHGLCVLGPRP